MNDEHISKLIDLTGRLVLLAENYWRARTKLLETPEVTQDAEVWKRGEPGKKAETKEEYRDLPATGPGRFSELVRTGTPARK